MSIMYAHDLLPRSVTIDLNNHEQRNWMAAYAIPIQVVTSVLLWIRIATRFSTHGQLGLDDVLILCAWVLGTVVTGLVLYSTYQLGVNRHVWDVSQDLYWRVALVGWLVEAMFFWSTCFTKVSVLMFYRRLVQGTYSRKFKWAIWAAIGFVIAYTITFFVVICVGCTPFEATWMQYNPNWVVKHPKFKCSSRELNIKLAELIGGLSVITDFYSVMLPAALIMQIRLNTRQKYGLFFIFGVGFLVVGAGIVRTIYLRRVQAEIYDKIWFTFDIYVASIAECNVAILCACAPSLKAVFGRYYNEMSQKYGSSRGGSKDISPNSSDNSSRLERTFGSMKRKLKPDTEGDTKDQSSFREAHEYGLETMSPLASGYGDGLVQQSENEIISPMKEEHKRTDEEKVFGLAFQKQFPLDLNVQGPGSFIISPSPSVSSDDEASLIDKKERPDAGLPYGLPIRDEDNSSQPNARPRTSPEPVPSGAGSIASPYSASFGSAPQITGSQSPFSTTHSPVHQSNLPPHAITTTSHIQISVQTEPRSRSTLNARLPSSPSTAAGPSYPFSGDRGLHSPFGPTNTVDIVANEATRTPELRKKLSKERWRQVYETSSRYPAI